MFSHLAMNSLYLQISLSSSPFVAYFFPFIDDQSKKLFSLPHLWQDIKAPLQAPEGVARPQKQPGKGDPQPAG